MQKYYHVAPKNKTFNELFQREIVSFHKKK